MLCFCFPYCFTFLFDGVTALWFMCFFFVGNSLFYRILMDLYFLFDWFQAFGTFLINRFLLVIYGPSGNRECGDWLNAALTSERLLVIRANLHHH